MVWFDMNMKAKNKYIPLAEWAERHGVPMQSAKDALRRGCLRKKGKILTMKVPRLFILEDADPTELLQHRAKRLEALERNKKPRP